MEKICGIYKITSPTGKIYIGQSRNILCRWRDYMSMRANGQIKLKRSFVKHGVNNHVFEILEECAISELNRLEKYYVDKFSTFNTIHGLNLRDGGGATGAVSNATKLKISKSTIGVKTKNTVSGLVGVSWAKRNNKWSSCITIFGEHYHLGYFDDKLKAAVEYKKAISAYNNDEFDMYYSGLKPKYKTKFKGVSFVSRDNIWIARIKFNDKLVFVGNAESQDLAISLYRSAEESILNGVFEEFLNSVKRKYSSRFRGVHYNRKDKRWNSILYSNGIRHYIGSYNTEAEAANKCSEFRKNNPK